MPDFDCYIIEPGIGLMLPCNVVVHEVPGTEGIQVDVADPIAMLGIVQNAAMLEIAKKACGRLERVVAAVH